MKKFFNNIKKYYKYAIRSAKAELKSEVADSYLNWLWWVIEPLSFMLIYSLIFGTIMKRGGDEFKIFVLLGLTIWEFFNRMITGSVKLIIDNRDLVTKVYLPKYILLLSKSFTYLFKMAISFCICLLMMLVTGVEFNIYMLFIIPIVIIAYILAFGIGMILMHFGVTLNDLANLTTIGLKMLFYLSGVFYNIKKTFGNSAIFGKKIIDDILLYGNPIAFCMQQTRDVTLSNMFPNFMFLGIWGLVGILLCMIGIHLIHKNENSYAKVI